MKIAENLLLFGHFRMNSNQMYGIDAWGEDGDYYNDRPGAQPPSPKHGSLPPQYASPGCNLPVMALYTTDS